MGAAYFTAIFLSSLMIKRPPAGYLPAGYTPPAASVGGAALPGNVPVDNLLKTPQFWLLWSTATLLATGGIGLMAMAAGNLGGRIGWATVSDKIGRWNTFQTMTLLAIPLFAGIPHLINQCILEPTSPMAPYYLAAFCGSTVAALTVMGGTFAVLPAYEADLYGSKYVGAIHGKFLPFNTIRGIIGPAILLHLRSIEEAKSIEEILRSLDPEVFKSVIGEDISSASALLENK